MRSVKKCAIVCVVAVLLICGNKPVVSMAADSIIMPYYDETDEQQMTEIFNKIKDKMFSGRFINWVEFKNELKTDSPLSEYGLK